MGPRVTAEAKRLLRHLGSPLAQRIYDELTTWAGYETGRTGNLVGFVQADDESFASAFRLLLNAGMVRIEPFPHLPELQLAVVVHLEPESLRRQAYDIGEAEGRVYDTSPIVRGGYCDKRTTKVLGQFLPDIRPLTRITEARRNLLLAMIWPDTMHGGQIP